MQRFWLKRIEVKRKLVEIGFLGLFFVVLWAIGMISLDPDFGWHLTLGKLISHQGFPRTDPYSYTMPNFPFVDFEWLADIFIWFLYSRFGMWLLSGLSALVVVLAFLVANSLVKKIDWRFKWMLWLLAAAGVFSFVGVRVQVVTWLFLAILLRIIFDNETWKEWRLVIPLLFVVWANLHGGFVVGLASLMIVVVVRQMSQIKLMRRVQVDWG